ncbi:hypothetical protein TNCV_3496501 [Trichonephila clavipes]|nr:hypothetical protein TNCV_3496501 [Trichonephila clavipes]
MAARAYMWLRMGTMTGQRYIDEFLLPHVRLSQGGAVGDKFCFYGRQRNMSSNTRCSGLFWTAGIQRLVWPAFSRSKPH